MCDLVCDVDRDIEVIQQEVEVETAPLPKKKKWTQGKVLRCGRKRLPKFSEQCETQRRKSNKATKTKQKTKDSQKDWQRDSRAPSFTFHASHAITRNFLCGFK